jgi:predicted phage terminase large subunit-like protein
MPKKNYIANLVPPPADNRSFVEILADIKATDKTRFEKVYQQLLDNKGEKWLKNIRYQWDANARPKQLPPEPLDKWRNWVILAGRGFGKTRTGAETVRKYVDEGRAKRIALVGATAADVNKVMIGGESGIMNCYPEKERPHFIGNQKRIVWRNPDGTEKAVAECYSAEEYNRLRGPQHDFAWADEIITWRYKEAWDMLMFGLRLGFNPQVVVTTTPKPMPILLELLAMPTTWTTVGTTYENRSNLAPAFYSEVITKYEGQALGRQELNAEILEDIPNALWDYDEIDLHRVKRMSDMPDMLSVVLAIDPATTSRAGSAETGMAVVGYGADDHFYVLHLDAYKMQPDQWARKAIELYEQYECDKMIAEVNNGGDLVETVIKSVNPMMTVHGVHASRGKAVRADPIATLYKKGRVHHAGTFARAEEQMVRFNPVENPYEDKDMVDALVWGMTWLFNLTMGVNNYKPAVGRYRPSLKGYKKLFRNYY